MFKAMMSGLHNMSKVKSNMGPGLFDDKPGEFDVVGEEQLEKDIKPPELGKKKSSYTPEMVLAKHKSDQEDKWSSAYLQRKESLKAEKRKSQIGEVKEEENLHPKEDEMASPE
jgi:hypothetical protein